MEGKTTANSAMTPAPHGLRKALYIQPSHTPHMGFRGLHGTPHLQNHTLVGARNPIPTQ